MAGWTEEYCKSTDPTIATHGSLRAEQTRLDTEHQLMSNLILKYGICNLNLHNNPGMIALLQE